MEGLSRGDLVIAAFAGDYGKPRPALVVQADAYAGLESVTLLRITSTLLDAPSIRIALEPGADTGLENPSQVMVDKITTVPRRRVARRIGSVEADRLAAVETALRLFLGLR